MRKLFVVAIAAALSAEAVAEPAGNSTLPNVVIRGDRLGAYRAPRANTATRIDADLRDVPQTVDVVPEAVLRDQGVRSLEDALKNVPGIGLSHGDGQRDQVVIRGFSAIGDQFVDGLRDDALYFRDLANIERIEVLKGPASVLYGRGSSGGLINRVTKKPDVDVSELTLQGGSWNDRRAQVDVGRAGRDSLLGFRLTGAAERADSYRDPQFLERSMIAPSLRVSTPEGGELLLQADHLEDRRVTDFGVPAYRGRPVDVDPGQYYGAANARDVDWTQSRVSSAAATITQPFGRFTVRNAFRYYDYELIRNNTLVGSVNEATRRATLNRSNVHRAEHGFFNQTEVTHTVRLGPTEHRLLYGVEVGRQHKDQLFRTQNAVATVDLLDPVLPVLPLDVTAPPSTDNVGMLSSDAVYIQNLASLTPQWKLLAGLRYDRFRQATDERRPGQPDLSREDGMTSPRLGAVWQPTDAQAYYVAASRSYQPSGESFPLALNNADIAPERTTNREVGAKFDFLDRRAALNVSLFRLERTNIKFTDPVTNRLTPVGVQRTDGLELSFAGVLAGDWQIAAGYAYLDAQVTRSPAIDAGQRVEGKQPTLTPRHQANLWLTKTLPYGFGIGGGANYVDDRFANPGNTVMLPGYTVLNTVGWWRSETLDLQLNVTNLTNRRYFVSGHGSSANLNLPGAPRAAQLTIRWRL